MCYYSVDAGHVRKAVRGEILEVNAAPHGFGGNWITESGQPAQAVCFNPGSQVSFSDIPSQFRANFPGTRARFEQLPDDHFVFAGGGELALVDLPQKVRVEVLTTSREERLEEPPVTDEALGISREPVEVRIPHSDLMIRRR